MLTPDDDVLLRQHLLQRLLEHYKMLRLAIPTCAILLFFLIGFRTEHRIGEPTFNLPAALFGGALTALGLGGLLMASLWQEKRLIAKGVFVQAVITQANNALFEYGGTDLPAVVCFSTDPRLAQNQETLRQLAHQAFSVKRHLSWNLAESIVGLTLRAETYIPNRRTPLPKSWTGGIPVYIEDIMIERSSLQEGKLVGQALVCLADPGRGGLIRLVPYYLLPEYREIFNLV
jgi:hypothetical protein